MKQTFKKQVKWRKDKTAIFICNCKTLIDLKIDFKYENFLKKLSSGIDCKDLIGEEKQIFNEFETLKYLAQLETKQLSREDFDKAMNILDNELGKKGVRDKNLLAEIYEEHSKYFIGLYLENELIGVICGFPREDYLLMSELAIDFRFQKRGFGKLITKKFEEIGFAKYNKIQVGAGDDAIHFYKSMNYSPFLLVQFDKGTYSKEDFSEFEIKSIRDWGIELEVEICSVKEINESRKKYPKAYLQYIFIKKS
ncbi:hypothetical protein CMI44_01565 [Candidatus Pacearchaeota archaeon]|nr:hypothetical protein [Candidatus Pacearchaeota archaeon]